LSIELNDLVADQSTGNDLIELVNLLKRRSSGDNYTLVSPLTDDDGSTFNLDGLTTPYLKSFDVIEGLTYKITVSFSDAVTQPRRQVVIPDISVGANGIFIEYELFNFFGNSPIWLQVNDLGRAAIITEDESNFTDIGFTVTRNY